jgi:dihydropyrimidinase
MDEQKIDLVIKNGVVVSGKAMKRQDVLIRDGRIQDVGSDFAGVRAEKEIDAGGRYVLPGIIDAHFHPVYADRIDTLSKAAATGGITTLIPYVGAVKAWGQGGDLVESINAFIEEGQSSSILDFGVHCTFTQNDMAGVDHSIPTLIKMGVVSFKGFTAYKKRGMKLEDEELLKIMPLIAENNGLFATHAENGPVLDYLEDAAIARGEVAPEFFPPTHPGIAEAEAVFRVLSLAQVTGCPMYLPHLSARESLEVVKLFKEWDRQIIFTETCPHYLAFTDAELKRRGSLAKMSPPLRKQQDVDALWSALENGMIDVIGSDAAGHAVAANEPLFDEIFAAPHGIPGLDTLFNLVYEMGVNDGRITLPHLVKMTCENPAIIFGLYPQKGILQKGADADVVIFDPARTHTIPDKNPHTHVDYSLYAGRRCLGAAVVVIQRGQVVMANGEIKAEPGQGRFLAGQLNWAQGAQ